MKKRMFMVLALVAVGALLLPMMGCGGGGGAVVPPPVPNNWDQMLWDQGEWQ